MKGDRRLRHERRARHELNHARRQVEFYLDKLVTTGQTGLYEAAYLDAQRIFEEKLRELDDLASARV